MITASVDFAKSDMLLRQLSEAVIDAKALVSSVEVAINQDRELITESELIDIKHLLDSLKVKFSQDENLQNNDIEIKINSVIWAPFDL